METTRAITLDALRLVVPEDGRPLGTRVLAGIVGLAGEALRQLKACGPQLAVVGRLRGTGRGVHFGELVAALEAEHPLRLESPFEDSRLVAGAAWVGQRLLGAGTDAALAKLRWDRGADDLPLHVHDFSDRFIIVMEGRGFFHVTDEPIDRFSGRHVRSIPARERDVFVFSRGVVHTFSTLAEPMTLLSCQMPYLAFNDPDQFRLPSIRWTARDNPETTAPAVGIDPAWTILAGAVGSPCR